MGFGEWFLVIILTTYGAPPIVIGPFDTHTECMRAWNYEHKFNYSYQLKQVACMKQR